MGTTHQHKIATDRFEYTPKKVFISMLVIFAGIVLCSGITFISIDFICVGNANAWLPQYPNAEVISETHTFLRPWGMGVTRMVLHSDDDRAIVADWYLKERAKNGVTDPVNLLATMSYSVRRNSDGSGTTISLSSDCAWT